MSNANTNPIDYEKVLPIIMEKLFPNEINRQDALEILAAYGTKSFHQETARVRTAILKVASTDLSSLRQHTETACCDFRDILCLAEYPSQSKRWGLKKRNPEKYQRLVEDDRQQHREWIEQMTG